MDEPRQAVMQRLGDGGCYLLSLVWQAERETALRIDAVEQYLNALRSGWCRENCFLLDPARIFTTMVGWPWTLRKEAPTYMPSPDEREILRFERPTPGLIYSHFVVGDMRGGVAYDPLGDSLTVAEGQLVSKRILRRSA